MSNLRNLLFCPILLLCLYFAASPCHAKTDYLEFKTLNLKAPFKTKKDWRLTVWQDKKLKDDSAESAAARYSFWYDKSKKEKDAVPIVSGSDFDRSIDYPHQAVQSVEIVKVQGAETGVLIEAAFSGGGSGRLTRTELWVYDPSLEEFRKALCVNLTEQGVRKFISAGPLAGAFITADAHWGVDESHFEAHYFSVDVYKYEKGSCGYNKVLQYLTGKKYESLDSGAINVIDPELPAIQKNLKVIYGPKFFPLLKPGSMAVDSTGKTGK